MENVAPLGFEPQILQPLGSHYIDKVSWLPLSPVQSTFSILGEGELLGKEARDWRDKISVAEMGCWADRVFGLKR